MWGLAMGLASAASLALAWARVSGLAMGLALAASLGLAWARVSGLAMGLAWLAAVLALKSAPESAQV